MAATSVPDARAPLTTNVAIGLASEEAGRRLKQFGPNAVADTTLNPFRMALEKFWAPRFCYAASGKTCAAICHAGR